MKKKSDGSLDDYKLPVVHLWFYGQTYLEAMDNLKHDKGANKEQYLVRNVKEHRNYNVNK